MEENGTAEFVNHGTVYTVLAVALPLITFLVGMSGNILVIIVIVKRRSLQTPTNCYLLSLSVADCLLLLSSNLPTIPEPLFLPEDWPYGSFMCTLCVFLGYLGANASALSIAAFTIERYIGICHSLKAQTICTVKRARRILLVSWAVAVIYCSPWLGLATVVPQYDVGTRTRACTYRLKREQFRVYYTFDLVIFYIIPLLLSTILYTLIIKLLMKNKVPQIPELRNAYPKNRSQSARIQVIRMLIVIVALFGCLWLPYRTIVVYNSFQDKSHQYKNAWFWLFCRVMVFVNSAINPVVYNMLSIKFRRAFRDILCKGSDRSNVYNEGTSETVVRLTRMSSRISFTADMLMNGRIVQTDKKFPWTRSYSQ